MKTTILILIVGLFASFATAAAPDTSQEIIIGLSPFQPAAERTKQQELLQRFVIADCPNGSRVVVWDGWALHTVFEMQLPTLRFDSPAARAPRVAPGLIALKKWFSGLDSVQVPPGLKDTGVVKVPEWLSAATAEPARSRRTIVLLASPFCIVPNEPSFSMANSRYPSDGHLSAGDKSIYSIADKHKQLENTILLWSYGSENIWASQNHRERVARWWALFAAGQGGIVGAFSADTPQVLFAATRPNHRAGSEYKVNTNDAALVMHTAVQREVSVDTNEHLASSAEAAPHPLPRIESPLAPAALPPVATALCPPVTPPIPLEAPLPTPPPEAPRKRVEHAPASIPLPLEIPKPAVGNIGVAAVWSADPGTDIDLWVAPRPGQPEAYWKRPRVPQVRYARDIRTAQTVRENAHWRGDWEYAEIENAQIVEPTVWLNVYEAKGPVSGIIRVQFDGHVVDHPFRFNVANGNRGRDSNMEARSRSPYWQEVKLADFFQSRSDQTIGRSQ